LVDDIFGSVSEFNRQVDLHGDEFNYGKFKVTYDSDSDIHSFWLTNKKNKKINESISVTGKTYINVDIQPEYESAFGFQVSSWISFLNENYDSMGDLIFLYNGRETLGMITEEHYKMWLAENGLDEGILDSATFYDKGYAFFRYCIDEQIDEDAVANFVKFMYQNDIRDSRDMNRNMWAKYLRQFRKIDRTEVCELLKHANDCVNVPDLMEFLKSKHHIVLTGGGINECLKEVEIALKALDKSYSTMDEFTY
jgi:hypothetical protein